MVEDTIDGLRDKYPIFSNLSLKLLVVDESLNPISGAIVYISENTSGSVSDLSSGE
jgi:hypothetical protein